MLKVTKTRRPSSPAEKVLQVIPKTVFFTNNPERMEVVLTRLRDFSCKEPSFEDYKEAVIFREQPLTEETCRDQGEKCDRAGHLDIASALAWLRRELVSINSEHTWSNLEKREKGYPLGLGQWI